MRGSVYYNIPSKKEWLGGREDRVLELNVYSLATKSAKPPTIEEADASLQKARKHLYIGDCMISFALVVTLSS